jgi:hypothetical protein
MRPAPAPRTPETKLLPKAGGARRYDPSTGDSVEAQHALAMFEGDVLGDAASQSFEL